LHGFVWVALDPTKQIAEILQHLTYLACNVIAVQLYRVIIAAAPGSEGARRIEASKLAANFRFAPIALYLTGRENEVSI
jgi:hypothetical protein